MTMTMGLSKNDLLEGRYRIFGRIGEGGMGVVYAAEHVALHRKCAIKVLHPSEAEDETMIARFRIEAQAAANIHHANIVEVMDFGIAPDNRPFFVMEYLDGESLAERLDRRGRLSVDSSLEIAKQILKGLAAAHRLRVVHRDLKPENIFLTRHGEEPEIVKILDFGISKIVGGTPSRPPAPVSGNHKALTRKGIVFGTPGYMAPETLFGTDVVDSRADLFSVAVLLFEMLVGKRPFHGAAPQATMIATASQPAPSARVLRSDVTPALDDIILKGLAKRPEHRFQSAKLFYEALNQVGAGPNSVASPMTSVAASMPPRPPEPCGFSERVPARSPGGPPVYRDFDRRLEGSYQSPRARRRSFSVAFSPVALLLIAGIGAGVYYLFGMRAPVQVSGDVDPIDLSIENRVQRHPVAEPLLAPVETVSIWLEASPPDVKVHLGDRLVYERPLIVPKGELPLTMRFSSEGYRDEVRQVVPDQEQTIIVKLKRAKAQTKRR